MHQSLIPKLPRPPFSGHFQQTRPEPAFLRLTCDVMTVQILVGEDHHPPWRRGAKGKNLALSGISPHNKDRTRSLTSEDLCHGTLD